MVILKKLNKYCVEIEKISYEKVMVYAGTSDEAVRKAEKACENGKIDFSNPIEEKYDCEIDYDSVVENGTDIFDDENYSDVNTQVIK